MVKEEFVGFGAGTKRAKEQRKREVLNHFLSEYQKEQERRRFLSALPRETSGQAIGEFLERDGSDGWGNTVIDRLTMLYSAICDGTLVERQSWVE